MTTRKSPTTDQEGFTLLELMIAILIGALVMTAVYSVFTAAVRTEKSTQKALVPLRGARYAFSILERDLSNLDPFCQPREIRCEESSCLFPVEDGSGKRTWSEYSLENGKLQKTGWPDSGDSPNREKALSRLTLCRGLAKVVFKKVPRGKSPLPEDSMDERRSFPGMINLTLRFGRDESPRDTYRTSVLFEITPQPLNAQ